MIVFAAAAQAADLVTYLFMDKGYELNPLVPRVELAAILTKLGLIAFVSTIAVVIYKMREPLISWAVLQFAIASGFFAASTNVVAIAGVG